MQDEVFIDNPVEMAASLLEDSRNGIKEVLIRSGLNDADLPFVLQNLRVDRGLHFSLQPQYQLSPRSFRQFADDEHLSQDVVDRIAAKLNDGRLYIHQEEAIDAILKGQATVVATGTGSGKTESFLIPILDHCARAHDRGVKALLVYPMNALANDQVTRIAEYTRDTKITFGVLTGATPDEPDAEVSEVAPPNQLVSRREILSNPPDILLTNYVMLERVLTVGKWRPLIKAFQSTLRFVVLDELHTYRGSKAAHLMLLLRRLKSFVATQLVPVGASATLGRRTGFISPIEQDREMLEDFLCKTLGTTNVTLVTPRETEEVEEPPLTAARTTDARTPTLRHRMSPQEQSDLLCALTGTPVSSRQLRTIPDIRQSEIYERVARHPFVQGMKTALREGARSLEDLALLYRSSCPAASAQNAEAWVRSWLAAINIINQRCAGRPFLDLRVHLFLREVRGALSRCILCGSYHPGAGEFCFECGRPLFAVDKTAARWSMAKMQGRRLVPSIEKSPSDENSTVYVRVSRIVEGPAAKDAGEAFRIKLTGCEDTNEDEIALTFEPDEQGEFCVQRYETQDPSELKAKCVRLTDFSHPREHVRRLLVSVLNHLPQQDRKLLGFVDDRERASQDSSVLRDELASAFLEDFLRAIYPAEPPFLNLRETLEALKRQAEVRAPKGAERELFDEIDLWFYRFIGEPVRFAESRRGLLTVKGWDGFSNEEKAVASAFLNERAIDVRFTGDVANTRFLRYQKHWALTRRQMHCTPADAARTQEDVVSISLSEDADEYAAVVESIGWPLVSGMEAGNEDAAKRVKTAGAAKIREVISKLVDQGFVVRCPGEGNQIRYALNPDHVIFNLPHDDRHALRQEPLCVAALHSAELAPRERKDTEKGFRAGSINFLLSTPTLEVGIDIGGLQHILMLGVPPMPSNYTQRAGRAGRRGEAALIMSLCSDSRPHDQYYFLRPKDMIDGLISPPAYHEPSDDILKKHLRAHLLSGHLTQNDLADLVAGCASFLKTRADAAIDLFGDASHFDIKDYLSCGFQEDLRQQLEETRRFRSPIHVLLYDNGFLPDYGFHREAVRVWERKSHEELVSREGGVSPSATDFVTEREPEIAFTRFAPERVGYIGGEVYRFSSDGEYRDWSTAPTADDARAARFRAYKHVIVDKEIKRAAKDALNPSYARGTLFRSSRKPTQIGGIVSASFDPSCDLLFLNWGTKKNDDITPFQDAKGNEFRLGYKVTRQALLFGMDAGIFSDRSLPLSFLSALDRTIKDRYRLDESELRLITYVAPASGLKEDEQHHFVFYDWVGNGDPPLEKAFAELHDMFAAAAAKLRSCPFCTDGCYYCLKSYSTQYVAPLADKAAALNVLDYLLGDKPFAPSIKPFGKYPPTAISTVVVRWQGPDLVVEIDNNTQRIPAGGQDSETLYRLLAKLLRGTKGLRPCVLIRSNIEYLVSALNEDIRVRGGRDGFSELAFVLARASAVRAERIS